jgi:hypothetical protein
VIPTSAQIQHLNADTAAALRTATQFPALSSIIRFANDAATIARNGPITLAEEVTLANDTLAVLSSAHVGTAQLSSVANDFVSIGVLSNNIAHP